MTIIDAVVFGIVQAMTTFFPVSASGHLVLTGVLFGVNNNESLAYSAIVYLAIALGVLVYFSTDFWVLLQAGLRKLGRLPVNRRDEILLYSLLVASIPSLFVGFFFESFIQFSTWSPLFIAAALVGGSFFFIYVEWVYQQQLPTNEMYPKKGLFIGLCQLSALIPGISRVGVTMASGMLFGLSRTEATRFAFLLVLPVMTGAGIQKFLQVLSEREVIQWLPVFIGSGVTFFVTIGAIHFMIVSMRTHTLWPFIWYRILLAAFVVFVTVFG